MKKRSRIVFLCLMFIGLTGFAQNRNTDSLLNLLKNDKEDTTKAVHLNALAKELAYRKPDTAIIICKQALAIVTPISSSEFISSKNGIEERRIKTLRTKTLGNLGNCYFIRGDLDLALEHYSQALKLSEDLQNKKEIAKYCINIGGVYGQQSNYSKGLDFLHKALKMNLELKDSALIGSCLVNIGSTYMHFGDYTKALEYHLRALELNISGKNKKLQETLFGNIGLLYRNKGEYSSALEYHFKALAIAEQDENKVGIVNQLCNIGTDYSRQGDHTKALDYHSKALKLSEEISNKSGTALNVAYIGDLYIKTGKFKLAEEYLKRAVALYDSMGVLDNLGESEQLLSQLYDTTGRYKEALIHYRKAMSIKDSLFSLENSKQLLQKEMNLEFEKKEAITQAAYEKEMSVAEADKKKQQFVFWSVIAALVLIVAFTVFILRSLRITNRQNAIIGLQKNEVLKQKEVVEKQNEKIVDSITYAKNIQQSILVEEAEIQNYFLQNFIYYQPKDIVSGDFYWFSKMDDKVIVAVVDCTGHGVPGAFMSMIGNTLLNQIVNENQVAIPSEILRLLNIGIYEALHQDKNQALSRDGMDIALCCIDYKTRELQFAGALLPLYIIAEGELTVVNGDRYSVGGVGLKLMKTDPQKKNYTNHSFPFKDSMRIYLFTDGYMDQFGGSNMTKFGVQQFRELIVENSNLSMQKQKEIIVSMHDRWKDSKGQTDDILVVGIKINS